jgi:gliding motility-associated-like protein
LNLFSCYPRDTGLIISRLHNQFGCDSTVYRHTSLLRTDTTYSVRYSCNPSDTGLIINRLRNLVNCDSLVYIRTNLLRRDTTHLVQTTCNPNNAGIRTRILPNQVGCDSLIITTTRLLPSDTTRLRDTTCKIENAGIFIQVLKNRYGCDSTLITNRIYIPNFVDSLAIVHPISCFGKSDGIVTIARLNGGITPYRYVWSNASRQNRAENLAAGWHRVTISDGNGCNIKDSIQLIEPKPIRLYAQTKMPICYGDANGSLSIDSVANGHPPLGYRYNNASATVSLRYFPNVIKYLPAGRYHLEAIDAQGCTADTVLTLLAPPQIVVKLPDTVKVMLGDSIQLKGLTNFTPNRVNWYPKTYLTCDTCLNTIVNPLFSTRYRLLVRDSAGCTASDTISVLVEKPRKVFIPTTFSPNGDGQNDIFMLHADDEVLIIKTFQVFNRWGIKVFEKNEMAPNDDRSGWDGTFKNENLESNVYIYFFIVQFKDGEQVVYSGDITLFR